MTTVRLYPMYLLLGAVFLKLELHQGDVAPPELPSQNALRSDGALNRRRNFKVGFRCDRGHVLGRKSQIPGLPRGATLQPQLRHSQDAGSTRRAQFVGVSAVA